MLDEMTFRDAHRLDRAPGRLGNGRRRAGFLGLVCVFLLTAFGAPAVGHAGTFNYSGTIDASSPTYQRTNDSSCGGSLGPTRPYQAQPFTVDVGGSYTLKNESNTFTPNDPGDSYFALYSGSFNPASAMTNCIAVNDDGVGNGIKSLITINLVTGTNYILVTSPFGNSTGNFANSITGPGTASGPATPTVTTPTATAITNTTATLGGNVTSDGNVAITGRGVVYSQTTTNNLPAIAGTGVTQAGTTGTTGVFTVDVSGLSAGIGHSYRAYATNSLGTSYSPVGTFTTTGGTAPTFTSVNANSFVLGQNATFTVTATGGPLPALSHTSGTLPNGITFANVPNTGTATLGGTPAAGTVGTYNPVFTATNASGSPTQNFTLTVVASASTANYSGTLDASSPSYQRTGGSGSGASCSIVGPTRPYQAQPFTVDRNGSYALKNVSNTFTPFDSGDSYFDLYTGTFTPGSPMTNCTAANDDESPADIKSKITANLVTGTAYFLVTTPFGNSTGNFANSITGPGTVTFPPTVSDISKSGNEDTQITFTAANFDAGFSDSTGDVLATVRVTSLPANGTLKLSGGNVSVNQDIPRAQLGNLTFDPASNFNGSTSFGWNGSDGTNFAPSPALVNITITAVNDAPTLNAISDPAAILEDAGLQTVNLSGISAGGGESQTLTVTATSGNTGLIPDPTVTYTSPNATGSLSYTPVAHQSGSALITVTVTDNGGTANGGVNTTSRTFTVNVTAVNDAPTLNAIPDPAAILQDAGAQTVNLSGISAGPNESQTLTVTATSGTPGLIPNPTVTYTSPNATGSLSYTPVANQSGSALITVTVTDNGGTANGGINTTTRTFTVNVTANAGGPPTCAAEPTDSTIAYGSLVTCTINNAGDTDTFRFAGRIGERIVIQASRQSGGGIPCLNLTDPDTTAVGSQVCSASGARIDTTLAKKGTYAIVVSEQSNAATMPYTLVLERLAPPSPLAQGTEYGLGIADAINPIGDLDVFAFRATAGDTITVDAARQSGGTPCIELFAPDGTPVGAPACDASVAHLGATLAQTGTYAILVSEGSNDATMAYLLTLQCSTGACTTPTLTATIGLYRPGTNTFYLRNSNNPGGPVAPDHIVTFGAPNDLPVVGDWDGNGTDTSGLFRPNSPAGSNTFFLRNSNSPGLPATPDVSVPFGASGDVPLVGDWDGNGTFTIGVYRPSNSTFYLKNSNSAGLPDIIVPFGASGGDDLPVVGDWDGNGTTTIGVYRQSENTFYLRNSNDAGGADHIVLFGAPGDLPVVGDWDGNGTTTVGLYRSSTATFYLHNSNVVFGAVTPDITVLFGGPGDLPLAGHWGPLNNLAPVAVNDVVSTTSAVPVTGDVLAANPTTPDTDADGDLLTVIAVNGSAANVGTQITLPGSNAKLTLNADGSFTYDPNGTSASSDSFTYMISDPTGRSASATVTITITP